MLHLSKQTTCLYFPQLRSPIAAPCKRIVSIWAKGDRCDLTFVPQECSPATALEAGINTESQKSLEQ